MTGFVLQRLRVSLRRGCQIARCNGVFRSRQNVVGRICPCLAAGQLLHKGAQLRFRNGAHESVNRLAVLEGVNRWNGLDAQLTRDFLILVDVDLDEADGAPGLVHHLLQQRPQLFARATPRRPEIDDHRRFARSFENIRRECLDRAVLDVGACVSWALRGRARRSSAPERAAAGTYDRHP